jgi:hypothetical protein
MRPTRTADEEVVTCGGCNRTLELRLTEPCRRCRLRRCHPCLREGWGDKRGLCEACREDVGEEGL